MITISDMKNENDFYDHCNEFEYNHDCVKLIKCSYIFISMYTKHNYTYMCESIFICHRLYRCRNYNSNEFYIIPFFQKANQNLEPIFLSIYHRNHKGG